MTDSDRPRTADGRWVKGQSGNPNGSPPKALAFAACLRDQLDRERAGTTTRQRIAEVVVGLALKGDLEAVKWIVDRVDGKVPDRLEADLDSRHELRLADDTLDAVLAYYAAKRRLGGGAA